MRNNDRETTHREYKHSGNPAKHKDRKGLS